MLLNDIKSKQLQARKARDGIATAILTTLIGEAAMVGKNQGRDSTDAEVVDMVKKFIKNARDTVAAIGDGDASVLLTEIDILSSFLPTQITGPALVELISSLAVEVSATSKRDMGTLMQALKDRYSGQYDGGEASSVVKGILK